MDDPAAKRLPVPNALRWLPQLRERDVVRAPWPAVPIAAIDPADIVSWKITVRESPAGTGTSLSV
jgi:hypothetical protein